MKQIQLWSIAKGPNGVSASPAQAKESTETEMLLEELLVRSPGLLAAGLTLVGRQLPTEGGPLDLLGIDEDGRLVVLELKRGILTREAVAQALDYASDLKESEPDRVLRLIQDHSGRLGIEKFDDFEDWYSDHFPNSDGLLAAPPKVMLVGLGVDDRARRIVNFLADAGVDIELLTFHAFENGGQTFLARQVESVSPVRAPQKSASSPTKEGNLRVLQQAARELGVLELLDEVAKFIVERMSGYLWPGKTAYTLSLPERTAEGRPTLRAYVTLQLDARHRDAITISFFERATQYGPDVVSTILANFSEVARIKPKYNSLDLVVSRANWDALSRGIEPLLTAVVRGRASADESDVEAS